MKKAAQYFLLLLLLQACGTHTETCSNEGLQFRLTGFSRAEGDTVIIRRHELHTGNPTKDSIVYYSENELAYHPDFSFDTLNPRGFIADTFDVSVTIPGVGKTVWVTEIMCEPQHSEEYKIPFLAIGVKWDECYNRLISYKVDGVRVDHSANQRGATIDIRR